MRFTWKQAASVAVAAAVLPVGLAACAPTPKPLRCTVAVPTVSPVVGEQHNFGVTSAQGARVTATVGTQKFALVTDAHGEVMLPFKIARAGKTNIAVAVTKGTQRATCTNSFTAKPKVKASTPSGPVTPPAEPSTPVETPTGPSQLTAQISPVWTGKGVGQAIPGGVIACMDSKPGDAACGAVKLTTLVSGFSKYGGIPVTHQHVQDPITGVVSCQSPCDTHVGPKLTGTVLMSYQLVCNETGVVTTRTDVLKSLSPYYRASDLLMVDGSTRVDSDSAKFTGLFRLPIDSDARACTNGSTLISESVRSLQLHLEAGSWFPASDFSLDGPFTRIAPSA